MSSHVVWDNDPPGPPPVTLAPEQQMRLWCKHCGDRYLIVVPAAVDMVAGIMQLFERVHRSCKPRSPLAMPTSATREVPP